MEKRYFKSFDDENIPYLYFESPRKDINNNIVIFHGMVEPAIRYKEYAEFLCTNGYNVYIMEIRGHGELKKSKIGDFGKKGINGVFEDIKLFFYLLEKYGINRDNTIIFGHSLGSLIATKLMIDLKYKYLIISGFPLEKKMKTTFAQILTYFERILFFKKNSMFNEIFLGYNNKIENTNTNFDWLTRDKNEVNKYIEDENCGYLVTPKFFTGIFKTINYINKNYTKIQRDSKILLVYGTEDKAMNIKYTNKFLEKLKKQRRKVSIIKNKNGRHESLNEINKYVIYDEILDWLNENKNIRS